MWTVLVERMLTRLLQQGHLQIIWPDGRKAFYGDGSGPLVEIGITDASICKELCLRPELALGEGYMDGRIAVAPNQLGPFLAMLVRNRSGNSFSAWIKVVEKLRNQMRTWMLKNNPRSSQQNVAHHYDISDDLYRLFLDEDMQYSCAYFAAPDMTLDQAQIAKKRHIAQKLRIKPGMEVLDIGCGWGGMALTLAKEFGARVTGVTLSENQLATAQARAEAAGLADVCKFELRDYRTLDRQFDRIVSVGMFEHVGPAHYGEYFEQVNRLLTDEGIALIHTICYSQPPRTQSAWILKYIFPGGHVPALSEIAPAIEHAGLWQMDIEILRLHYAETLLHWRDRFEAQVDTVQRMYDDQFVRMFRFYLVACEMSFREMHQAVYQFQLAKRINAVPITRDYLYTDTPPGSIASE